MNKISKYDARCQIYKPYIVNNNLVKRCTVCDMVQNINSFYIKKENLTGYSSNCRKCQQIINKRWRLENPEKDKAVHKKYALNNKEKTKIRESQPKYKENAKKYRTTNKYKQYQKKYRINRMKNDINFKMRCNLTSRIGSALNNITDTGIKSQELLGCKISFFVNFIESQFTNGMAWNNYGIKNNQWHIDHIICIEVFDMTDERQQFAAFNYKNCKPMWASKNRIKSDFLHNGKRARDLSKIEKLEYLKSIGYNFMV